MRAILGSALALMFVLTAGLSADDKKGGKLDSAKLLGKWKPADAKKGRDVTIEFAKDGKLIISASAAGKEIKIEGTYKIEGNKLALALSFMGKEQKETLTVHKLTDEELTTEDSKGKKETLKRVKAK